LQGLALNLATWTENAGGVGQGDVATIIGSLAFIVFAMASIAQLAVGFSLDRFGPRPVFMCVATIQFIFFSAMPGQVDGAALAIALGFMLGAFGQIPINDFMIGKMASGAFRARIYGVRYVVSFSVLEPNADGFRNYLKANYTVSPEEMLLDKAQLMCLTAPELTVLLGGMRVLNTNFNQSNYGVFTKNKELLSNDFFINLLDINTTWSATSHHEDVFEGRDRSTGYLKWTGTRVDLIFGSNSELRAIAEVYGFRDANEKFVRDFVSAWTKVMNLDRFDIE
jgi:hypothetical protein